MVTIRDIARECKVSIATVSRALKDDPQISVETRQMIKKVAKDMDYHPNQMAIGLKLGRSSTIGIITNDFSTFAVPPIISGIEEVADQYGYSVILSDTANDIEKEKRNITVFRQKQVAGIIFVGTWSDMDQESHPLEVDVPFVAINRRYNDNSICTINHDDHNVSWIATEHLIRRGCRRLAFINGPLHEISPPGRLEGFVDAVRAHGLELREHWIGTGDWAFDNGYYHTTRILQAGGEIPDGVVAGNDYIAVGVLHALFERGLRVPDDVAVIGCDNNRLSWNCQPKLTTVRLPLSEMGQAAAELLFGALLRGEEMQSLTLTSSIVSRESS